MLQLSSVSPSSLHHSIPCSAAGSRRNTRFTVSRVRLPISVRTRYVHASSQAPPSCNRRGAPHFHTSLPPATAAARSSQLPVFSARAMPRVSCKRVSLLHPYLPAMCSSITSSHTVTFAPSLMPSDRSHCSLATRCASSACVCLRRGMRAHRHEEWPASATSLIGGVDTRTRRFDHSSSHDRQTASYCRIRCLPLSEERGRGREGTVGRRKRRGWTERHSYIQPADPSCEEK